MQVVPCSHAPFDYVSVQVPHALARDLLWSENDDHDNMSNLGGDQHGVGGSDTQAQEHTLPSEQAAPMDRQLDLLSAEELSSLIDDLDSGAQQHQGQGSKTDTQETNPDASGPVATKSRAKGEASRAIIAERAGNEEQGGTSQSEGPQVPMALTPTNIVLESEWTAIASDFFPGDTPPTEEATSAIAGHGTLTGSEPSLASTRKKRTTLSNINYANLNAGQDKPSKRMRRHH